MKNDRQLDFVKFREDYKCFNYNSYKWDIIDNTICFEFDFDIGKVYNFNPKHKIKLENIIGDFDNELINNIVFNIGMVELVSYWKSTCSPKINLYAAAISNEQKLWWKKLWFNGLGEFFFLNNINTNINDFVDIDIFSDKTFKKSRFNRFEDKYIVPVGGGKDSVVSLEIIKAAGIDFTPYIMNPRGASEACANISNNNKGFIKSTRKIDTNLLDLNKKGFLNGHTPFSSLLAFTSLLLSVLSSNKYIALSNESSANEATDPETGANHQYSKSFEFEKDFREYYKEYIIEEIEYFSLLRAIDELQIASLFSQNKQYHSVFKSCNKGSFTNVWCCKCSKCLFTNLMLSPYLSRDELKQIFGTELLDDNDLLFDFQKLIGVDPVKPFECVGTVSEVRKAVDLLIEKYPDIDFALIKWYKRYKRNLPDYIYSNQLNMENYIPQNMLDIIKSKI